MKILKIRDVKTPNRGTDQSAGIDFFIPNEFQVKQEDNYVTVKDKYLLAPGNSVLIPSGIKVNIPTGYALIAFNKSGVAVKKSIVAGACVIDEDYQGEIHFDLKNIGKNNVELLAGDKIIQFICLPVNYVSVEEVSSQEELYDTVTERGEGGFGSTGTK